MAGKRSREQVILDTNVLLSGIFFGGVPGRVLEAWQAGRFTLVLSPAILAEYRRTGELLAARYAEVGPALAPILAHIIRSATIVDAPELPEPVSADPADDKFLACAVASRTRVIVSGDKHLLRVSGWRGIQVVTPRQLLDHHLGEEGV